MTSRSMLLASSRITSSRPATLSPRSTAAIFKKAADGKDLSRAGLVKAFNSIGTVNTRWTLAAPGLRLVAKRASSFAGQSSVCH